MPTALRLPARVAAILGHLRAVASILRTGLGATTNTAMSAISKFGRRSDREFTEKAVALVLGGRSYGEVSHDLGVSA